MLPDYYFDEASMKTDVNSELNIIIGKIGVDQQYAIDKFRYVFSGIPSYIFGNHILTSGIAASKTLNLKNFQVFIYGDIYEGISILESFQQYGSITDISSAALCELNGSFVILLANIYSDEVYIITDRTNSKRIFLYKDAEYIIMTTNPLYFKQIDSELNIGGLASYLINGVIYDNNTLYKNIHALDRASLYKIDNQKLISFIYWEYAFTNEYSDVPKTELRKTYSKILMQGVEKRLNTLQPDKILLSLSGGYDSRFLLGSISSLKQGYKLKTFSYGLESKLKSGDDIVAQQLALKFGFEHCFVKAFESDLLEIINLNVKYGHALANFCDEVDAWMRISDEFEIDPSSLLFVGDMFSHTSPNYALVRDSRIPLQTVVVFPWYYIQPFLQFLPSKSQSLFKASYDELYQGILSRLPKTNDYQVIKDFAYIDQRVSHTLMYWRNFFQEPFIKVAQPLLDNQILDFHRKLPNHLRYNKLFYKEVVREMFPELFEIPIAQNTWAYPSWNEEIKINRKKIIQKLAESTSRLDEIIPPDALISFINANGKFNLSVKKELLVHIVSKVSKTNDLAINMLGPLLLKHNHIKHSQLIIRLLVLRQALEY